MGLVSVPSYPLSNPWGYTGAHASPRRRTLDQRCHGDNRGKMFNEDTDENL